MNARFYDPVYEPILWLFVSIAFTIISLYFIYKYIRIEKEAKPFFKGLIAFSVLFTIARTIETYRRYYYVGDYYDIVDSNFTISGLNLILRLLYYIVAWTGISIFYFIFEQQIMDKKTKYLITICSILEGSFSCSLYFTANALWNFIIVAILFFGVAFVPIILFIYLITKSIYLSKKCGWIFNTIGFIFFILGVMGDLPESYEIVKYLPGEFVHYFNPIAQILGVIFLGIGFSLIYKKL